MKSGFFLSATSHGLLITFIFTNGIFSMPDRQLQNLEKLDIMILSEVEFDAISSSPPIIENLSSLNQKKLKNLSQDLKLQNNEIEKLNGINKHSVKKLSLLEQQNEIIKPLLPLEDFIPEPNISINTKIKNRENIDLEFGKLGNEINTLVNPTLNNPKPRDADRIDRIASNNKNTLDISDNLKEFTNETTEKTAISTENNEKLSNKQATTKITPDAKKNVEIVKGVVEKSNMPLSRSLPEITTTSKLEDDLNVNLQNTIDNLVETINQSSENADSNNENSQPSISTIEKLKLRKSINQLIGRYWNKGILIGGSDFENYVVKVEILLDNEGNIIGNVRPISPIVPYGRYAIAFREASNAIKAVGKIPIPSEKYKKGLKLKLTFDPALGIGFD